MNHDYLYQFHYQFHYISIFKELKEGSQDYQGMNLLIFHWTGELKRKPSAGTSPHSHMFTATHGRICDAMYV